MSEPIGFHPLANLFPLIEGGDFDGLVADVKKNGVHENVDLFEGLILDGRNRYRASQVAGVDVRFSLFEGTYAEATAYVVSKNIHRRHLNPSQLSMVGARMAQIAPGRPSETPSTEGVSAETAAQMLNVGKASIERAKEVLRSGTEELVEAVERGLIAVSAAQKAARQPAHLQRDIAKEAEAGKANVVRNIIKRAERTAREKALGKKQRELPDKQYGVILADPEWEFVVFSRATGLDRAADNHYPTSDERTIAARDVQKIAAKDCLLLLWTTDLARGIRVMESWGFTYKSYVVWVKDIVPFTPTPEQAKTGLGGPGRLFIEVGAAGTGYWNRDRDEILLIGTRGNVPAPSMGTQGESVIFAARPKLDDADRGKHSAKPAYVHEWVEEHFPNMPRIELNARVGRRGWDVWGNEAPEDGSTKADGAEPVVMGVDLGAPDGDRTAYFDPETGEVLEDLPAPNPGRSSLMPGPARVAAITDDRGMVQVDETHVVAAAFVTAGELAQAEAFTTRRAAADEAYETLLSAEDELAFQEWKAEHAPTDSGDDYDLRGAFKAGVEADADGHWPDTFKKPNHPTFSDESIYAERCPERAGHWDGDRFVPPDADKPIGLWVGAAFKATQTDPTPAPQFVEQPAAVEQRPKADRLEIPAFLIRTRREDGE